MLAGTELVEASVKTVFLFPFEVLELVWFVLMALVEID